MDVDPHLLLANDADPSIGRRSSGWKETPLPPVKKSVMLLIFLVDVIGGRGKGENPISPGCLPERLADMDRRARTYNRE
jgi:hypothetical protein